MAALLYSSCGPLYREEWTLVISCHINICKTVKIEELKLVLHKNSCRKTLTTPLVFEQGLCNISFCSVILTLIAFWWEVCKTRLMREMSLGSCSNMDKFGFNMSTGSLLGWQDIYAVYDQGYSSDEDGEDDISDKKDVLKAVTNWYTDVAVSI
jgi:hypothetical protein